MRVVGEVSEWFGQGVRQGFPLSPWLFNIFLDMVVREAQTNFQGGVKLDMPSTGSTVCSRHSLGHRNGGGPGTQHQCTADSSEGAQAGSELDKNEHNSNR